MERSNMQRTRTLKLWEECIGVLKDVKRIEDSAIILCVNDERIIVPTEPIVVNAPSLEFALGKRIAVVRTDLPGKEYLIRVLEN